ncbi:DNA glycosylase [Fomitiporia mediterranea MF3/22]|uniref:DNA glycosylase n=1 Tax=Fomitiporia mediterranea (strain MF3/22) TaxID=694068 RepID=UPI00044075A7|nr:DNA glycosylase [Fomitiporia mediterranea MF3/22]EJD02464.1 DNA glycosylase [Fomitiporia mediterranea MF3/22]
MSANAIPQGFKALPLSITQLSLAAVLKCGQSFRWSAFPLVSSSEHAEALAGSIVSGVNDPTHEYRFCLKDRVVCMRQSEEVLFYRAVFAPLSPPSHALEHSSISTSSSGLGRTDTKKDPGSDSETLAFIQDYFQLDMDLLKLYDEWSASDPIFRNLKGRFSGIRMLRQDPWECLISFICSSNNNISRISKMVQNLCTHFSPPLVTLDDPTVPLNPTTSTPIPTSNANVTYHPFPPPSSLAHPTVSTKLRTLGFGYRADFIQKTASMLLKTHGSDQGVFNFLEGLRKVGTNEAREELMKLMGVGRKVADCILLMSLDKREVIPVDTHVHQIALKHYGMRSSGVKTAMTPKLYDEVNARLAKIWGNYAGWAHSILFTADLKSFSTYGLPTPSPTPSPSVSPTKSSKPSRKPQIQIATQTADSRSPSLTRGNRKRTQVDLNAASSLSSSLLSSSPIASTIVKTEVEAVSLKEEVSASDGSLADRVKRRRRIAVSNEVTKEW